MTPAPCHGPPQETDGIVAYELKCPTCGRVLRSCCGREHVVRAWNVEMGAKEAK